MGLQAVLAALSLWVRSGPERAAPVFHPVRREAGRRTSGSETPHRVIRKCPAIGTNGLAVGAGNCFTANNRQPKHVLWTSMVVPVSAMGMKVKNEAAGQSAGFSCVGNWFALPSGTRRFLHPDQDIGKRREIEPKHRVGESSMTHKQILTRRELLKGRL